MPLLAAVLTERWRLWPRRALCVAGGALAVRVAYWAVLLRHYVPRSDAAQYLRIAHNFATGHGISDIYPEVVLHATAFRPPLYPALLGLLFKAFGTHVFVAQAANAVIGALVVVLVDVLVTRIATPRAGLFAAAIVAVTPSLVANDVVPLSEPLSLLIFLVVVILLFDRRWVPAGLATGLLLLTRPSGPALLAASAVWLVSKVGWKAAASYVFAAMVTVAPWIVRNQIRFHSPVLITSNGFNVNAVYSREALADRTFVDASIDPRFAWLYPKTINEAQWDRALLRHGAHGALTHPVEVARRVSLNTAQMIELWPQANRGAEFLDGRSVTFRMLTLPLFYLTAALGIAGFRRHRANPALKLLLVLALVLVVPSVATVAAPRLRAPLDLVLAISAGIYLAERVRKPDAEAEFSQNS